MKPEDFKVRLMLDSGVFSAWNRGLELDLNRYIQYVKDHKRWLYSYVNVDSIPGTFGQKRTQKEVEDSARIGYDNLQTMKGHGLDPIPVFHQGERFYWFERMIMDGHRYIGVSNAKDLMPAEQRRWLDTVFSIITNTKGEALIKTHGFGITNPKFLIRYPFYTVDSTTWSLTPGFGQIIVPVYVNGKPDYSLLPLRIAISGVAHQSPSSQKRNYEAMGPIAQAMIRKFLEEEVGINITQVRYGTTMRRRAVLIYFIGLCKHLSDVRFKDRQDGLHKSLASASISKLKPAGHSNLTITYATSLSREWSQLMNSVNADTRLLSYWELKDRPSEVLTNYVENGTVGDYAPRPRKVDWKSEAYINHRALALMRRLETGELDGTDSIA